MICALSCYALSCYATLLLGCSGRIVGEALSRGTLLDGSSARDAENRPVDAPGWEPPWEASTPATPDAGSAPSSGIDASGPDASGPDASEIVRPTDAQVDSQTSQPPRLDTFGVRQIYPGSAGGREWLLPSNAESAAGEWQPPGDTVTRLEAGVFRTMGSDGQIRMNVVSGAGQAWWQDVEVTGYFRYVEDAPENGQRRHFELLVRGERHTAQALDARDINGGVAAPRGTRTWPGYPYSGAINVHCLGTSYHGNAYLEGDVLFEKEFSHSDGYGPQRATRAGAYPLRKGAWFGLKLIVRDNASHQQVRLELWIDKSANGSWEKAIETSDAAGAWVLPSSNAMDGCTAPPFSLARDMPFSWAGPWVIFRADGMVIDFKWLSVREIGPL